MISRSAIVQCVPPPQSWIFPEYVLLSREILSASAFLECLLISTVVFRSMAFQHKDSVSEWSDPLGLVYPKEVLLHLVSSFHVGLCLVSLVSDQGSFCLLRLLDTHYRMSLEEVPPNSFSSLFLVCWPHLTKALVGYTSVPALEVQEPSVRLPTHLPPTPPQDSFPCPFYWSQRATLKGPLLQLWPVRPPRSDWLTDWVFRE